MRENKRISVFSILLAMCFAPDLIQAQNPEMHAIPDSVRLRLVYPADGDTINFDRVRYAGSVFPTAKLRVQNQKTRIYQSGAFVGLADLEPGENMIFFTAEDSIGIVSDSLRIFRPHPVTTYPETPTMINVESINPENDVYLSPGDLLEVEFQGSPKGRATFSVDKVGKNVMMAEVSKKSAKGIGGLYKGTVVMRDLDKYKPKQVEFKLRGKNGRTIKFKSKGKIHILSKVVPLIGVTSDSINIIKTSPDGEIWMALPSGIRMQIIGERDGVRKVRLAENVIGYIRSNSLTALPSGSTFPHALLGSIGTLRTGDWIQLRINLTERVPFQVEQFLEPAALEIKFYRALQAPQWITYPQNDDTIRLIRWRQEGGEIVVLRIELNQKQQWGYSGRYVGKQFWLNIRRTPEFSKEPASVFKGLTITVDAGHGGEFDGAVSPTGLFEKQVNLHYANIIADLLEAEGATVVRTRTQDTTMTLQERIRLAEESHSHIFVSLHNNSIGAATNPSRPRGTSTYYTVPQAQAIAKAVYQRLIELGLNPFGRVLSTYYVTRQTSLISLLVEGAFMTHPEDEMLLLDDDFLNDMAQAVVLGMEDFLIEMESTEKEFQTNEKKKYLPTEPKLKQF